MRVEAEHLAETLFQMFQQSGCNAYSDEFRDRAASIELVDQDEDEVIEALGRLRDMVADWQRKRH